MARFAGSARSPARDAQAEHRAPLWVKPHCNPREPTDIACPRDQPLRVPKVWDRLRAPHLLLGPRPGILQARVLPLTSVKLRS